MVERYRFWCQDSDAEISQEPNGGWVRYDDYARLQEQVEAQLAGHRLTAKEATANLIRANKAEEGLEEALRSCLAERAGRLAAEAERDRLREALAAIVDTLDAEEMGEGLPFSEHVAHWQKLHDRARAALHKEPQP